MKYLVFILTLLASPVIALEQCVALEDDALRLECYDAASGYTPSEKDSQSAPDGFGNWLFEEEVNAMTDDRDVFFSVNSSNEVRHEYSYQRGIGKATLIVRCRENSTALILVMDGKHMSDYQFGKVEYRLDGGDMKSRNWSESSDNKALGLWRGTGIPVLKDWVGGQKLIVRAAAYNESAQTMEFDIAGIDAVVEEIRGECGW